MPNKANIPELERKFSLSSANSVDTQMDEHFALSRCALAGGMRNEVNDNTYYESAKPKVGWTTETREEKTTAALQVTER